MRFIVLLIVLIQFKGYNSQQNSYPGNYDRNYERNYDRNYNHNRDGTMQPYHEMLHHHQPNNDYSSANSLPHNSYGPSVPLPQYVPRDGPSVQQVSHLNGYNDPAQTYRPPPVPLFDGGVSPPPPPPQQQSYYQRPNNGFHLPATQPNEIKLPQNIGGYELVHTGEVPETQNYQHNRPQVPVSVPVSVPHNVQPQIPQYIEDVPIQPQNNYPTSQNYYGNPPPPPSPAPYVDNLPLPTMHNEGLPAQIQFPQHHQHVPQTSYASVPVPLYPQTPSITNEGEYGSRVQNHHHHHHQHQVPQNSYAQVPAPVYSQAPIENIYSSPPPPPPQRIYAAEPLAIPPATVYEYDRNYSTSQLSNVEHLKHQSIPQSVPQNSYQNVPVQHEVPIPVSIPSYVPRDGPSYQPQIPSYDAVQNIPTQNIAVQSIPTHNSQPSIPSQFYGPQDRPSYPVNHAPSYTSQPNYRDEHSHRDNHQQGCGCGGESHNHQNDQHYNRDGYQVVNELGQNHRGSYSQRPRQPNGQVDEHGYQIINEGPVDHFVSVGTPNTEVITPRQPHPSQEPGSGRRPYRNSRRQHLANYINHYLADKEDQTEFNSRPNIQQESVSRGTQVEEPKADSQNVQHPNDSETQKP
ncbi:uncharacterized protein LOC129943197 [Eupeodes corollae]|uniref:uncharacterized protein LOC129943197 n=1 Tax=Eupeodes corollae TaxID=290404 RepID=UPI002490D194|nr:uncharacterized protein LOC129943197 [Eupeodes corollae]XP_055908456.1 uncharacterized protein LOC129943197 [Eupeodes corollae]